MKTVSVIIKGISPLLVNRFKESDEQPTKTSRGKKDYGTPRYQAENTAYKDEKTKLLWVPSSWIKGAVMSISSDYKLKNTRKSLKSIAGGVILPLQEKLYFLEKYKISDIEIDSRPVVVQRARIMRHRARLETWSFQVDFELDNELIDTDDFNQMLTDSGRRAGLGDFRASKGGPFGRFLIEKYTVKSL